MAIKFTCEVTDPHTEALLGYLESKYGADNCTKISVIELAKKWLELDSPGGLYRADRDAKQLLLVDDQIDACLSLPQPSPELSRLP